jgi:hypothetical protein
VRQTALCLPSCTPIVPTCPSSPHPWLRWQTQRALPFIVGCPACQHNFVHLWCLLTCSPDQATFTNVTDVQAAADTNATVVKEVAVWLDDGLSRSLYDSCKVDFSDKLGNSTARRLQPCCVSCEGSRATQLGPWWRWRRPQHGWAARSFRAAPMRRARALQTSRPHSYQQRLGFGARALPARRGPTAAGCTNARARVAAAADVKRTPPQTHPRRRRRPACAAAFPSAQDVKFGAANLPAMTFIGGGAKTPQAWLDFLGEVKDKRVPPVGSPFQLNFNPNASSPGAEGGGPPEGISPARGALPSCGDAALTCSCADCPAAPGCAMVGASARTAGPRGLGRQGEIRPAKLVVQ